MSGLGLVFEALIAFAVLGWAFWEVRSARSYKKQADEKAAKEKT